MTPKFILQCGLFSLASKSQMITARQCLLRCLMGLSNASQLIYHLFSGFPYFSKSHCHSFSCFRQKPPDHPQSCPVWETLFPGPSDLVGLFDTDLCSCIQQFPTASNLCGQDLDPALSWPMGSASRSTAVSRAVLHRFGSPEPPPDLEHSAADS